MYFKQKSSTGPPKVTKKPQLSVDANSEIEYELKPSESPVLGRQETLPTSNSPPEVNETVRASLQLLKKKPRGRGLLGRSSISESTDTLTTNEPQDSSEIDSTTSISTPQQQSVPVPVRNPPKPKVKSEPSVESQTVDIPMKPKKVEPVSRPRPMTSSGPCTRTSECTCALCVVPVDDLPYVEDISYPPPKQSNDSEPMIGSSKLTTLQKKRQEMNQQNTGKKKPSKSNV